ncbi:MAG: hypothetical protein E6767_07760 [Dysgonomonas sp.]|nr:hypothetical protein [Dysgonomonas sp.]
MYLKIIYIVLLLFTTQNTLLGSNDSIPKDAIPFQKFKGNVILDGYINDSIPIKALLDIGAWGIAVPRKHTPHTPDNVKFSIGKWSRILPSTYMEETDQLLKWYGSDCVLLGWDFFENKVLEISYKHNYIRVLNRHELATLSKYDCIKFANKGKRLIVPAYVNIDGKIINGNYWIDTGLNGTVFFTNNILTEHNININKTRKGRAKNLSTNRTSVNVLKVDAVQIGNSRVSDTEIIFSESEWFVFKKNDLYIGLIGNQFFQGFSVIFDFFENNLYLKPVED